jgi:hypothetical protein
VSTKSPRLPGWWSSYVPFWISSTAAAILVGWLAARCQAAGWSPVIIFPLGVGGLLGLVIHGLAQVAAPPRRRLTAAALALAVLAILAEHTWLYVDFRRQWREARAASAEAALFRPENPWSPSEYFDRESSPRRIAFWCLDAGLIIAGAVGVTWAWPRGIGEPIVAGEN